MHCIALESNQLVLGRHVFFGIHNLDVDERMTAKENAEIDGNLEETLERTSC